MIAVVTVKLHRCRSGQCFSERRKPRERSDDTELPWLLGQSQIAALEAFFQAIKTFGAKISPALFAETAGLVTKMLQ